MKSMRQRSTSRFLNGIRISEYSLPIVNKDDVDKVVRRLVDVLEMYASPVSAEIVFKTLSRIPQSMKQFISQTQDHCQLDLLHYSIINNNPNVVEYLLHDGEFFPPSHSPSLNPYAHLAALLGHEHCLRSILQYRPRDFFKSTKHSQALILPEHTRTELETIKHRQKLRMTNALKKLRSASTTAGRKTQNIDEDGGVENLDLPDVAGMTTARSERKKIVLGYKGKHGKKSFEKFRRNMDVQDDSTENGLNGEMNKKQVTAQQDEIRPVHLIRTKPRSGEHQITIYRDAFPELGPGVVSGVGQSVTIRVTSTGHLPVPDSAYDTMPLKIARWKYEKRMKLFQGNAASLPEDHSQVTTERKRLSFSREYFGRRRSSGSIVNSGMETPTLPPISNRNGQGALDKSYTGVGGKEMSIGSFSNEEDAKQCTKNTLRYMEKTPLTLAAEYGRTACVQVILEMVVVKDHPMLNKEEPITLATQIRSPESIMLLTEKNISFSDYQGAVLLAIRKIYPECLQGLLIAPTTQRQRLFNRTNLFHILYTESKETDYRHEMLPEMTHILLQCDEKVNSCGTPRTFPIYTLIESAFHAVGQKMMYYVDCLKMMLESKADPHFNEDCLESRDRKSSSDSSVTRKPFYSAISCAIDSARKSIQFCKKPHWPKLLLKKIVTTITTYDLTKPRIINDEMLDYMDAACELGIDRSIIRSLLRYGANPDFQEEDNYAVNMYFEGLLPYLTKVDVKSDFSRYLAELENLMMLCRAMTPRSLLNAQRIFLRKHLSSAPVQALPICRYFAYLINDMTKSPESLVILTARSIWIETKRNQKRVKSFPLPAKILELILP